MFNLDALIREHIKSLEPAESAHGAHHTGASVFLDANENAFGSPGAESKGKHYNRYPDPLQVELKERLSKIKGVPAGNIFLGNGSDEIVDLLCRSLCDPGKDNVLVMVPSDPVYGLRAKVHGAEVRSVALAGDFQLNVEAISEAVDAHTKMIFIGSPNDPTGNSMDREDIEIILNNFEGLVVIDEAYINYSRQRSFIGELTEYPNLIVVQTMSRAWGMAGVRIGMAFASDDIIALLNSIKLPYNISAPAQELAIEALNHMEQVNAWIRTTVQERAGIVSELGRNPLVKKVYPSDANFLLVKVIDAKRMHDYLLSKGIVVSDQSHHAEGCLRITVGTPEENKALVHAFHYFR